MRQLPEDEDAAEPAQETTTAGTREPSHELVITETEIIAGSVDVFQPRSFDEWEKQERSKTVLGAWSQQMTHERGLRTRVANWVFGLVVLQVVATFGVIVLQGLGLLQLDNALIKILIPTEAGEVLGLAYIVTKYLFSEAQRKSLDALLGGRGSNEVGPSPSG